MTTFDTTKDDEKITEKDREKAREETKRELIKAAKLLGGSATSASDFEDGIDMIIDKYEEKLFGD